MALKRRLTALKNRATSIFDRERERKKSLDLSGSRERAYRKRRLSLITKARLAASKRKQTPFKKRAHPRRTYLKRRL